jgi:flagellar biosynthesis regulator FlaF
MLEKQQKRKKRVHAVFLSSRIYTDFVSEIGPKRNEQFPEDLS